jgi:PhnB protein
MIKLAVGLRFDGNAEEAFIFYRSVFGGEFSSVQKVKDIPPEKAFFQPGDENKIAFIALPVSPTEQLTGDDFLEANLLDKNLVQGNNVMLGVQTESRQEAERIFAALSSGGQIQTPLTDQFWGEYYGNCRDRFGVWWGVTFSNPKS